jgi:hypothetical protein
MLRWRLAISLALLTVSATLVSGDFCYASTLTPQTTLEAAAESYGACKNDISARDPKRALNDCSRAAAQFKEVEANRTVVATLSARQVDELSFYVAYGLFGKAGAERQLHHESEALRDAAASRARFKIIVRHGLVTEDMLEVAKLILTETA